MLSEDSDVPEERCPLHPSFYKRECAHCQGLARGTAENPHFSIREYRLHRNPMVELLKNGGPVHRHDRDFSLGCREVRIILACVPALQRFAWPSDPNDQTNFQPRIFTENQLGVTIEVLATMNPNFVVRDELIEEYWLKLRELPTLEISEREEACTTPEQGQEFFKRTGYYPTTFVPNVPRKVDIGLGVMKCRAVCLVQDELRNWLARRCR